MARSLLGSFVSGARGMLSAQLFVSVGAVALAGWTLAVTNQLIRERDLLQERVIQLEAAMAERGMVVPATQTVVNAPAPDEATLYPGEVGAALTAPTPAATNATATVETPAPEAAAQRDIGRVIGDLFAPAPPMRVVVLHVRGETDAEAARRIGAELGRSGKVRVVIDVMPPRDPRQSGYAYFDGRQNRAAADLVTQFHDIARRGGLAPWSAQLRGVALPAQGEYSADRLDIVLPPLPPPVEPAAAPAQRAG
jgi:hypothetical protein